MLSEVLLLSQHLSQCQPSLPSSGSCYSDCGRCQRISSLPRTGADLQRCYSSNISWVRAVATTVNTMAVQVLQLLQSMLTISSAVTALASVTVSLIAINGGALVASAYTSITSIDNQGWSFCYLKCFYCLSICRSVSHHSQVKAPAISAAEASALPWLRYLLSLLLQHQLQCLLSLPRSRTQQSL